jgi:calcineurin-like phosphoesterase family protein
VPHPTIIGTAMIYFTSDTHFGHGGALGFYQRPFASVAAMDESLIQHWNAVVQPGDEVWHLGDFAIRQKRARVEELLARLDGRKRLVAGNNDPPETRQAAGWASVADYAELVVDGRALVLCHYPFRAWNGMDKGTVNLHGHSHGRGTALPRQFDVGVDVWEFRPVPLATLLTARRRSRP